MLMTKDYFKTIGAGVSYIYCSNNKFNYDLYSYTVEKPILVDVIGSIPQDRFKVLQLKDIKVTRENSKEDCNLSIGLAKSAQNELLKMGIEIEPDFYKKHSKFLLAIYMLTSLCVVFVGNRENTGYTSYLATKNDVVLDSLMRNNIISKSDLHKSMQKYRNRCHITDDEIDESKIHVIKLTRSPASKGLKIGAATVYPHSRKTIILPYFIVKNYIKNIISYLKDNYVKIEYVAESKTKVVYTTLNKFELFDRAMKSALNDPTKLVVYDYENKEEVSINVIDILNISKVK